MLAEVEIVVLMLADEEEPANKFRRLVQLVLELLHFCRTRR